MKNILKFQTGTVEEFCDVASFSSRIEELKQEGTVFNFQINSKQGREYFEDSTDYYSRMKELHASKTAFFPLIYSKNGWVTPNLHRKLSDIGSGA